MDKSNPTMLYHPVEEGVKGNQYTSDGVTYICRVFEGAEIAKAKKEGWKTHFTKFDK